MKNSNKLFTEQRKLYSVEIKVPCSYVSNTRGNNFSKMLKNSAEVLLHFYPLSTSSSSSSLGFFLDQASENKECFSPLVNLSRNDVCRAFRRPSVRPHHQADTIGRKHQKRAKGSREGERRRFTISRGQFHHKIFQILTAAFPGTSRLCFSVPPSLFSTLLMHALTHECGKHVEPWKDGSRK